MHSVKKLQETVRAIFERERFMSEPKELYEPFEYILSLGGKRLRPLLVLMSCDMFNGIIKDAFGPAIAIELFHNFTLIHDDIMDKAPLRRGKPTVHQHYNVNTAILSGDVMLVYAYQYLLKTKEQNHLKLLKIFNDTAIAVCEGQQLDMNYEKQEITLAQYLKMIELKTAVLLSGCMSVGAIIGGAKDSDVKQAGDFGKNIGIGFQLQDDILDVFGDGVKVGKQIGGDIVQNKKTFLYLKALELAGEATRRRLIKIYSGEIVISPRKKVEEVLAVFDQLKIARHAEKLKQKYIVAAFKNLDAIRIPSDKKNALRQMSMELIERES